VIEILKAVTQEIKPVFESEWGADFIVTRGNIIKYSDVTGLAV